MDGLPAAIAKAREFWRLSPPQLLIVSGDSVTHPTREAFEKAAEIIQSCSESVHCPPGNIVVVPGESDLQKDAMTALMAKSLRAFDPFYFPRSQKVADLFEREAECRRFIDKLTGCPIVDGFLPPTRLHYFNGAGPLKILALDSAFLSTGEDRDKMSLVVADQQLTRLLVDEPMSWLNILVAHHPPSWLAPSQREIVQGVFRHCALIIHGHSSPDEQQWAFDTYAYQGAVIGPTTSPNLEFQFIHLKLEQGQPQVSIFTWSLFESGWNAQPVQKLSIKRDLWKKKRQLSPGEPRNQKAAAARISADQENGLSMEPTSIAPYVPILVEVTKFVFRESGKWLDHARTRASNKMAEKPGSAELFAKLPIAESQLPQTPSDYPALARLMDSQAAKTDVFVAMELMKQIESHRKRQALLETQEAHFGALTPPHIQLEIEREADAVIEKTERLFALLKQIYRKPDGGA